jgi:ABC-type multidrug transport system ATPase subunit
MGPSGAGKTTFVTLLTGKVKKTNGSVLINGKTDELSKYSKLIGYVPQEDIMIRELTVRDVLMHSARMRLPRDWDYQKVKSKVIEIISFLGMSHVAGTIIGDEVTRGISGGQRKRVNIGMELVAEPSVLFLDEPTSGLDSSTAYEVCANLRNIAEQQGLTVGAVIHSPSPATFRQFHDFLLLGKGGQVVYMGPREDCVAYFESIGFSLPPDDSPSDYFMDVVSGKVANEFDPQFVYTDLFEYWSCRIEGRPNKLAGMRRYSPKEALERKKDHLKSLENPEIVVETPGAVFNPKKSFKVDRENFVYILAGAQRIAREWGSFFWDVFQEFGTFVISIINFILRREDPIRQVQPFHIQLWLLLKRAYLQVYKSAGTLISEMALHFSAGFFISIAVQNFDCICI